MKKWRSIVKSTYYSWNRKETPDLKGELGTRENLTGTSLSRALNVLHNNGIGYLTKPVKSVVIVTEHPDPLFEASVTEDAADGRFVMHVARKTLDDTGKRGIETILHEFGHIYDFRHGGKSRVPAFLKQAEAMYQLWETKDPVWGEYFAYPFSPNAQKKLKLLSRQARPQDIELDFVLRKLAEAYAQGFAASLAPGSLPLPPSLKRYFDKEIENAKQKGAALQAGRSASGQQAAPQTVRGLQPNAPGSTERGSDGRRPGFRIEPAEAVEHTKRSVARWVKHDPTARINPKVSNVVAALNAAGIVTDMSGDMYGNDLVYVDLLVPAAALDGISLPDRWVVTDRLVAVTYEDLGLLSDWHVAPGKLVTESNKVVPVDYFRFAYEYFTHFVSPF